MPEPEPEPDEVRFACIGCGTLNPAGARTCAGCGHAFDGPAPALSPARPEAMATVDAPRPEVPPPGPINPFEAPAARVARPPSFRIGTAMGLIAVIAICLGAFVANPFLGFLAAAGLIPASIRTALVAGRRSSQGRPMSLDDQALTFFLTLGGAYLVGVASVIAFGVTCFPVGMVTADSRFFPVGILFAVGLGLVAAVFAGVAVGRLLLKPGRDRERRERDREDIRWR